MQLKLSFWHHKTHIHKEETKNMLSMRINITESDHLQNKIYLSTTSLATTNVEKPLSSYLNYCE